MNLSSFFRSLKTENHQFAVIGLGRFGRAVCGTLHGLGYEVLGIDASEKLVNQAANDNIVSHALELDSTDPSVLQESGIFEFKTVIVAIGNYIEESIITTLNLKEGGVPWVVAKASSNTHVKLLKRVGADRVLFPEHEMGCNLARSLTRPGILDRFVLDPENSIVELKVPQEFDGKTIMELNLRAKYGINLLAIGGEAKFQINPEPTQRLVMGQIMVVVGDNGAIDQLASQA
jgi:trk system potassium uptake protein